MRLAKQSGESDVAALKERLTHRELVEWVAFWDLEREAEDAAMEAARNKG